MEIQGFRTDISRRRLVQAGAATGLASILATGRFPAVVKAQTAIRMITPAALGTERELYQSFVDDFMANQSEITVDLSFEAWDDYLTRLPTLFAGGQVPDVIHQHMSIVQDYGARGALDGLTPYLERDQINREDYIEALFEAFSSDAGVLAFPKDSAAWGIYYNKTKFDEAGIEYPSDDWTFDDFRETAKALTIDEAGVRGNEGGFSMEGTMQQYGFSWAQPTPYSSENVRGFVRGRGGDWYNEEMTETLITEQPALDHFRMFHEMRCVDGSAPSDAASAGIGDMFRQGMTAMQIGFHNLDFFLREDGVDFEWDVTFMPKGDGGQFVPVGASGWAIPAGAENKDAAWELIKHLVGPEVQSKIAENGRWGVSRRESIAGIIPEDASSGFRKVHVDPLTGESDRTAISFRFPANQSKIKQVYDEYFDPVWLCETDDIEGAAEDAKLDIDDILGDS
jgi:multiple sugar transport system substrate-binding protein